MVKNNSNQISAEEINPKYIQTNNEVAGQISSITQKEVTFVVKNIQPSYHLRYDTISAFLHETKEIFGIFDRILSYICLEIGIFTLIYSGEFYVLGKNITGSIVGILSLLMTFIAYKIIRNLILLRQNKNRLTVKGLTNDLVGRAESAIEMKPQHNKNLN